MNVGARSSGGSVRAVLGFALLAIAAVVLAGCASHSNNGAGGAGTSGKVSSPTTVTRQFHAYRADGGLAVQVGDVARGSCFSTSVAAPGADAYRCFAGNKILDPCFAPADTSPGQAGVQVACVATPWSRALALTLTQPLPKPAGPKEAARPWAFQLGNGARCVASTGTVPAVQGINLGYHCTDGHDAALVDPTASLVTAHYADATKRALDTVTVTTIWRL